MALPLKVDNDSILELVAESSPRSSVRKSAKQRTSDERVSIHQPSMEPSMPRYYFNIRQDKFVAKDEEGADLPNDEAAREEAVAGARDILSEAVFSGEAASLNRQIEVTDADGRTVLTVPVGHVTGTDTQS
jgi:hypothetical protein